MEPATRRNRPSIPASPRFEAVARGAQFRDRIALRVRASPEAIFDALGRVTLSDMKVARALGELRYLPGRLTGHPPEDDPHTPFLTILQQGGTLVLEDDPPREMILGSAGRLHQVTDQTPVRFGTAADFNAFDAPEFEKLFISVRVAPSTRPGEQLLVLEHATRALSPESERRFGRYWRVIKPSGAFVSGQLLKAVRARAEAAATPRGRLREGRVAARVVVTAAGVAAAAYAAYVGYTWLHYGRPSPSADDERDELLDRFIPAFDVVERHHIRVNAPAAVTLDAAKAMELLSMPVVRAIIRGRELILHATRSAGQPPRPILEEVFSLGWGLLEEVAGREIVVGAVTRPWEANPTFRAVAPEAFAAFDEPGYVKIAWTLRADPVDAARSVFRTETRAVATDEFARTRFRWYWACLSPGIRIIRRMSLGPVRREAERRARRGDRA